MTEQEKQYKDGFNSGYLLAKHEPELCTAILNAAGEAKSKSEYFSGLSIGHDVYISERIIAQNKEEYGIPEKKKEALPAKTELAKDYKKGFNSGYILSKYEPELTKKLLKTAPQNPSEYYKGLVSGK